MRRQLPPAWQTGRLAVADAVPADVPRLCDIFNSCHAVVDWDPTFYLVAESELASLVRQSQAEAGPDAGFRLQGLRRREDGELVGYFHLWHAVPEPGSALVSMFVIHRAHQAQHYGREAVAGLLGQLRAAGYAFVRLRVYLKNWPALRFWIGCGFTGIHRMDGAATHTAAAHASLILEQALADGLAQPVA